MSTEHVNVRRKESRSAGPDVHGHDGGYRRGYRRGKYFSIVRLVLAEDMSIIPELAAWVLFRGRSYGSAWRSHANRVAVGRSRPARTPETLSICAIDQTSLVSPVGVTAPSVGQGRHGKSPITRTTDLRSGKSQERYSKNPAPDCGEL